MQQAKHRARRRDPQSRTEAGGVERRLAFDEDVARHEVCAVAKPQDHGRPDGDARSPTQIVGHPRHRHGHLQEGAAAHGEQGKVADACTNRVCLGVHHLNYPAYHHKADAEQNEREPPPYATGEPACGDFEDQAHDPDWDGHDLGARSLPTKLGKNGGREGRDRSCSHVAAEEHEGAVVD